MNAPFLRHAFLLVRTFAFVFAFVLVACGDDDIAQDAGEVTRDMTAEDVATDAVATDAPGVEADSDVGDASPDAPPSCDDDTACSMSSYCLFPPSLLCARPAGLGVCTPRPERCRGIPNPVCGCDEVTYDNDCEARQAGISISHEGVCIDEGCGPLGDSCGSDEFCDYDSAAMCGRVNTGQCMTRPAECSGLPDRVCGCDANEYESECLAHAAGVSVAAAGVCETGRPCGGAMGIGCPSGFLCSYPLAEACGAVGGMGVCVQQPDMCPVGGEPVCGCNDQTYESECDARLNGISVAALGACDETGSCGGAGGLGCPDGQFCNYRPGSMCTGDGTCESEPLTCDDIDFPVCGCDNMTYTNACLANAAGYSVQADGPCS